LLSHFFFLFSFLFFGSFSCLVPALWLSPFLILVLIDFLPFLFFFGASPFLKFKLIARWSVFFLA